MAAQKGDFTEALNLIEKRIRDRLESKTQYGDDKKKAALLQKLFARVDVDGSGTVGRSEFEAMMVQELNLVGQHKLLMRLFDRYDEDASEEIEYDEFVEGLLGVAPGVKKGAMNVIDAVKNAIIERGGANGIRTMGVLLRQLDENGNGSLSPVELREGLSTWNIVLTDQEVKKIMQFFDRDGNGSLTVDEFMRGLAGKMPRRRAKLVRLAYKTLDRTKDGVVTMEDVEQLYDVTQHPDYIGADTPEEKEEVKKEVLAHFASVWDNNGDGTIAWDEFFEYYKDLSIGIASDDHFELMIRNAWHLTGGDGHSENTSNKRVCVVWENGDQTVEEIEDDLGLKLNPPDIPEMKRRLLLQKGVKKLVNVLGAIKEIKP